MLQHGSNIQSVKNGFYGFGDSVHEHRSRIGAFFNQKVLIFFLLLLENNVVVLIRSSSLRPF